MAEDVSDEEEETGNLDSKVTFGRRSFGLTIDNEVVFKSVLINFS
jgi:hypothetical protein